MKKQEILDGDWKNLIILDACRYDIFKEMYDNFFRGNLEPRLSRGNCTSEWLVNTFIKSMNDVTYFSTVPFVNKRNYSIDDLNPGNLLTSKWKAQNHFGEIIECWDRDFSEEYGVVHPKDLKKRVLKTDFDRGIIHFMQPHLPYLTNENREIGGNEFEPSRNLSLKSNIYIKLLRPVFGRVIDKMKGIKKFKLKKMLGFELSIIHRYAIEGRGDELLKYYEDNLRIVLEQVSELVEQLDGKTIITADHGESFGENGYWGHAPHTNNPVQRIVPWLEIER